MGKDRCPRDWAGFCQIALMGHRLCPGRDDRCHVTDRAKAYNEARADFIKRSFKASPFRRARSILAKE